MDSIEAKKTSNPSFAMDGIDYGVNEVASLRSQMIEMRDTALCHADFSRAVLLSHSIGVLYLMAHYVWGDEWRMAEAHACAERRNGAPGEVQMTVVPEPLAAHERLVRLILQIEQKASSLNWDGPAGNESLLSGISQLIDKRRAAGDLPKNSIPSEPA